MTCALIKHKNKLDVLIKHKHKLVVYNLPEE